ncbi:hypothetical protein ACN20G_14465 [Streptomyces sp. BI20]|uniref:hypothetical protein n=1 Tax=Streptomyces sp. BI20 TaxID=3403460 RepID=UPI003C7284CC
MFTIKYNATTNHIDGVAIRTTSGGSDAGGYVTDYSQNACGSITRYRLAAGKTYNSLADALNAARQGGRKLCKTCEKAALAQLAAEEAAPMHDDVAPETDNNEEAGNMTAKLKLSEVRGDVMVGATNGGKMPHALKLVDGPDGALWAPYCGTKAKTPFRSWGAAHEQKGPDLELCIKCSALVETGPVEILEETVTIPGLDRAIKVKTAVAVPLETPETGTTNTEEKEATMAAKTMDKAAQDKAAEDVRASIERIPSLAAEGKGDAVTELAAEIKTAINKITGTGAAGVKATLKAELTKAEEAAKEAAKTAPKAEVASLETQNWEDIPGAEEKVSAAAKRIGDALVHNIKFSRLAREIADTKMELAVGFTNKHGDPDIMFAGDSLKNAFRKMTTDALAEAGIPDTFEGHKTLEKLLKAIQNQHASARRDFVASLDSKPELAARFEKAAAAHPDKPISEAVFEYHKISRGKSKLELEEDKWNADRAAELAAAAKKELTSGEGEGEGTGEGEGEEAAATSANITPDVYAAQYLNKVEKANKNLDVKTIGKVSEEGKKALREKLEAELEKIKAAIAALL